MASRCPRCSAELAADAPEGLCPACLLRGGAQTTPPPSNAWIPPTPEEIGRIFPELDQIELIGRGGMGAVYKVRQVAIDRVVALKILPSTLAADPEFALRFTREAQAMARLSHPNIVALFEFGERGELFYLVMEYVDGASLRHLIDTAGVSPREALAIIPQICDALQFAHDRGIVHRDIKPENILLDRQGHVKIADFGLARMTGAAGVNVTQVVLGTPYYMAPEQMTTPQAVDHRADIYSLGVVFYQLLTGELPIGRFEPPSRKALIDVRLDDVVLRSLAREPERRYQHVSEVKTQVQDIASAPLPHEQPGIVLGLVLVGRRNGRVTPCVRGIIYAVLTVLSVYAIVLPLLSNFIPLPSAPYSASVLILALVGFIFRGLVTPLDRLIDLGAKPSVCPRQTLLTAWKTLLGIARLRDEQKRVDWWRVVFVLALALGFMFLYQFAVQLVFGIISALPGPFGALSSAMTMVAGFPLGYLLATRLWRLDLRPAENPPPIPRQR